MTKFDLKKSDIKLLCEAGATAASGGNIQPWLVNVKQNRFTISVDQTRGGNLLDVDYLGSIFSIGSFVENVVIAATHLKLQTHLQTNQPAEGKDFRVILDFLPDDSIKSDRFYPYLHKRCTNRKLHTGKKIEAKILDKLIEIVELFDKNFGLFSIDTNPKKQELIDILGQADGFRTVKNELFSQMLDEIRWNDSEATKTKDGIDIATMELPPNFASMFKLLKRFHKLTQVLPPKAFENQAKPLLKASSHLILLWSNFPANHQTLFVAGRIMQRLWLELTINKIAVHPWTVLPFFIHRVEQYNGDGFDHQDVRIINNLATRLREICNLKSTQTPIFIFRISRAKDPTARSLRRDWESFTSID